MNGAGLLGGGGGIEAKSQATSEQNIAFTRGASLDFASLLPLLAVIGLVVLVIYAIRQ